jgi:quinol monooxygenase YgiN
MIVGTLRILPGPDRRADVLEILRSILGPVLAQPGCVDCSIYEEEGPDRAVLLIERFDTDEALRAHLRSELYRRILGALELSEGRPDVRFERVSAREGLEVTERQRLRRGALQRRRNKS